MIPIMQERLLSWVGQIGFDPNDQIEERTQKSLLVAASLLFLLAGLIWGIAYIGLHEPRDFFNPQRCFVRLDGQI